MILQLYDPGAELHSDRWSNITILTIIWIRFAKPLNQVGLSYTRISCEDDLIILFILLNKLS